MTTGNTSQERNYSWLLLIAVLAVVGAIWYFTDQILTWLGAPASRADRGQFGDMYGAINTLFSGLAFAFLIANTYMQSRQLKMQQVELALTRKEIAAQLGQMKEQSSIFDIQVSDSIFFKLIESLQTQLEKIGNKSRDGFTGAQYLHHIESQITTWVVTDNKGFQRKNLSDFYERIEIIVRRDIEYNNIVTYLSVFNALIKIAEKSPEKYISILSAIISQSEKYTILSELITEKNKTAIDFLSKYNFFGVAAKMISKRDELNQLEQSTTI